MSAHTAEQLIAKAGGVGEGWELLKEGEPLKPGDGFAHPDYPGFWSDYECRPDLFRGSEATGCPKNETAHTYPWRRKTK